MAWSTLCALVLGGIVLAVAVQIARAAEAPADDEEDAAAPAPPAWSTAIGRTTPFNCGTCGALHVVSSDRLAPRGVRARCRSCGQVTIVRPKPPPNVPARPPPLPPPLPAQGPARDPDRERALGAAPRSRSTVTGA